MKALKWICLLIGLAMFAYSFKLPAIREIAKPGTVSANTLMGYNCAVLALVQPWGKDGMTILHSDALAYLSILISGWINPVFLLALIFLLFKPGSRVSRVFLILMPLMFVFCWIVFQKIHFYAFTGFYVWMCGILLALFSDLWVQKPAAAAMAKP